MLSKKTTDKNLFNIIGYTLIISVSLLCVLPILLILSGSLTKEAIIYTKGYSLIPGEVSFDAYKLLFKAPMDLINAYVVSISLTVVGTVLGLFLTSMTAYVIQRKDLKYRNHFSFYFYFTTLFSGGLVPWYMMMIHYFHMKNNPLALLLPPLINVFNILIMKSFFRSLPDEISESAVVDGAGDFTIFIKIIVPISKSSLTTIGLFIGLGYWNDWYNAMLYITDNRLIPMQFYLYNILGKMEALNTMAAKSGVPIPDMPKESFKLAVTVISILPALFVYPFAQKYFVKGVTIGAVKG